MKTILLIFPFRGGSLTASFDEIGTDKEGELTSLDIEGVREQLTNGLQIGLKKEEVKKLLGNPNTTQVIWEKPFLFHFAWFTLIPTSFKNWD